MYTTTREVYKGSKQMNDLVKSLEGLENRIQFFNKGEVSIEYLVTGDKSKDTIVFGHSLSGNIKQFIPHLSYFSNHYRMLFLSLRGHGNSGLPNPESEYNYTRKKYANDIMQLTKFLGIDQFHYVGNSYSGVIGYELLAQYPETIKTLTTVCSPAKVSVPHRLMGPLITGFWSTISKANTSALRPYINPIARQLCTTKDSKEFFVDELISDTNLKAAMYTQKDITRFSYLDMLKKTTHPVLIINGQFDRITNIALKPTLAAVASNPYVEAVTLKKSGHFANLDQPQEFNQLLSDFISRSMLSSCCAVG